MTAEETISIAQFCAHHSIEVTFVQSLGEHGLVQVVTVNDIPCLPINELRTVEQFMRLHYDLNINLEGLDAISHLLQRVGELQHEITLLRNRIGEL